MPLTADRRKRSGAAFAVSAALHALMACLIFNMAFSAEKRLARGRVTLLYTPAPAHHAPRFSLPLNIPALPSPVPSLTLPIPPRPAPAAIPEPSRPPAVPPPSELPAIRPPETAGPRAQPAPASFGAVTATAPRPSGASPVQIGTLEGPRAEAPSPQGRAPVAPAGFSQPTPGGRLRAVPGSPAPTGAFGDSRTSSSGGATPTRGAPSAAGAFGSVAAAKSVPPDQPLAAKPQFETIRAQTMGPASRPLQSSGGSAALEILHKPRPEYSAEGRFLKIEGEVVLDVLFAASGEIRVLRVLHGLGHGLDESAARAAAAIQFRPAVEHGQPADTVATVRIQFQLAD